MLALTLGLAACEGGPAPRSAATTLGANDVVATGVRLDRFASGRRTAAVRSDRAHVERAAERITFSGEVVLFDDRGRALATEQLLHDASGLHTDSKVVLSAPGLRVEGWGLRLDPDRGRLHVRAPARVSADPPRGK